MKSDRDCVEGRQSAADIDKLATIKALSGTDIPPEQKNDLRERLCGCVWTQKKQFDCQEVDTRSCPFCGEEPEDEDSMLWRTLRREKQAPTNSDRLDWPPYTSRCGICLVHPKAVNSADGGAGMQPSFLDCSSSPENVRHDVRHEIETRNNDSVVAWTDGALTAMRTRDFDGLAAASSLAWVSTETARSLQLGVSRQVTEPSCWR